MLSKPMETYEALTEWQSKRFYILEQQVEILQMRLEAADKEIEMLSNLNDFNEDRIRELERMVEKGE